MTLNISKIERKCMKLTICHINFKKSNEITFKKIVGIADFKNTSCSIRKCFQKPYRVTRSTSTFEDIR